MCRTHIHLCNVHRKRIQRKDTKLLTWSLVEEGDPWGRWWLEIC